MSDMKNIQKLSKGIKINIPTDEYGLVGRECPKPNCEGYFKIKLGTGIQYEAPCICPYCGHSADPSEFWTKDQIAYARSIMVKEVNKALKKDIKEWDKDLRRQSRNSFIKLSVDFRERHYPIHYYREQSLETRLECQNCGLVYSIFGIFSYCPDCGTHNSIQILKSNLELVAKEIELANNIEDKSLSNTLISDALENSVSAFDGFGRESCRIYAKVSRNPKQAQNMSFQALKKTNERIQSLFGFDLSQGISEDDWIFVLQCFEKRHLLAHKMGIVDAVYIEATNDSQAVIGRKVNIKSEEVIRLTKQLDKLGTYLVSKLSVITKNP